MALSATRHGQWKPLKIVCFTQPDMDGNYLSEADYSFFFSIVPNIQQALDQRTRSDPGSAGDICGQARGSCS
jgi:hypothetical protein